MSENDVQQVKIQRRHIHIFFPMLLIIIGLFFLLSNLNLIPGDAASLFFRFWPLLFVLSGLEDLINGKWVGAVFNVGIGGIFVLANLGYFPWTAWEMIWKFWPVFIIAIGLDIIFSRQTLVGSLIGVTFSILIIGGIAWLALNSSLVGKGVVIPVEYKVDSMKQVEIALIPAIADLEIDGEAPETQLLVGDISLSDKEELIDDFSQNGSKGTLTLQSDGVVIFPSKTSSGGFPWKLNLNDDLPMDLSIDQGVGKQELHLSGLNLTNFDINLGIGQAIIELPEEEAFDGQISCAIGQLIVYVPKNIPIKIKIDSAITTTDYPDDFIRDGDWLYSPGAQSAAGVRTLEVSNPIGSLSIKTK